MKKHAFLLVTLAFGLAFVSCTLIDNVSNLVTGGGKLSGMWKSEYNDAWEFTSTNTAKYYLFGVNVANGTYSVSGNTVTITIYNPVSSATEKWIYRLSGNTLTLINGPPSALIGAVFTKV